MSECTAEQINALLAENRVLRTLLGRALAGLDGMNATIRDIEQRADGATYIGETQDIRTEMEAIMPPIEEPS